jgi:hypothetical protein
MEAFPLAFLLDEWLLLAVAWIELDLNYSIRRAIKLFVLVVKLIIMK